MCYKYDNNNLTKIYEINAGGNTSLCRGRNYAIRVGFQSTYEWAFKLTYSNGKIVEKELFDINHDYDDDDSFFSGEGHYKFEELKEPDFKWKSVNNLNSIKNMFN